MKKPAKADRLFLRQAIALGKRCPQTDRYAVGAVITDSDGQILTTGYSREFGDDWHAEEVAIEKARRSNIALTGTVIYSSMEPCHPRLSGKTSCAERIIEAGISKVVFCLKEPDIFVHCEGTKALKDARLSVIEDKSFSRLVYAVNSHLIPEFS